MTFRVALLRLQTVALLIPLAAQVDASPAHATCHAGNATILPASSRVARLRHQASAAQLVRFTAGDRSLACRSPAGFTGKRARRVSAAAGTARATLGRKAASRAATVRHLAAGRLADPESVAVLPLDRAAQTDQQKPQPDPESHWAAVARITQGVKGARRHSKRQGSLLTSGFPGREILVTGSTPP